MKFLLSATLLLLAGCAAHIPDTRPVPDDHGQVFLYTRPFSQQAHRLDFTIHQLAAVREDGFEIPLTLAIAEIKGGAMARQRMLASGSLPPGEYVALSFTVKRAALRGEEGDAGLLLPEGAVRVNAPFTVARKKASFLSLEFRYDQSVKDGFAFSPAFTVTAPGKPVAGLVGYVANRGSNTLTVFDRQAYEVVGVIATGREPRCVVIDQQRRRGYIAIAADNMVEVFDTASGEMLGSVPLHQGDEPVELALLHDGKQLVSVNHGSNTVSFIDPLALAELERISVGTGPSSIAVDPGVSRAFVFNDISNTVSVLDPRKRAVVSTLATQPGPSRGQFNRRGDVLYISHAQSSSLDLLNPLSLALQQQRTVGTGLQALKVDRATDLLYAARRHSTGIELFEPSSFIPLTVIGTGGEVVHMAIDAEQNNLYAAVPGKRSVVIINAVSKNVVAELDVDANPSWVALAGER